MGHSVTCTFHGNLNMNTNRQIIVGIMTVREGVAYRGKRIGAEYVESVELWPQTARGRALAHYADYIFIPHANVKEYRHINHEKV